MGLTAAQTAQLLLTVTSRNMYYYLLPLFWLPLIVTCVTTNYYVYYFSLPTSTNQLLLPVTTGICYCSLLHFDVMFLPISSSLLPVTSAVTSSPYFITMRAVTTSLLPITMWWAITTWRSNSHYYLLLPLLPITSHCQPANLWCYLAFRCE